MEPRLKTQYQAEIAPALQKEFGYGNIMQVPHLDKIVLNMGMGEALQNPKAIEFAQNELTVIAGQKAVVTRARKSIANFKLREGQAIGCRVTLRREQMYEFIDRLINVALPRVRDFRGVSSKAFDGHGNYSLGVTEQVIFPEVDYDKLDKVRGLSITFVTSANTDDECFALLKHFGMPFRK